MYLNWIKNWACGTLIIYFALKVKCDGISEKWDPGPRDVRTRDPGLGTRDSGPGTLDSGPGTRDSGPGTRDSGPGTRDPGLGIQNFLFTMQTSPFSIVIEKKRKI